MKLKALTIIAAICLGVGTAHAAITKQIAYQGVLKDGTGNYTGTVDVTVNIYAVSGGDSLYTEAHTGVAVANGLFTIHIGSVTSLDLDFADAYELGVTIGTDPEMAPRVSLLSAPTAINAAGVNIDGGSAGDVLTNDGTGKGAWGPAGAGPKGDTGEAGAAGAQGPQGKQGDTGPAGADADATAFAALQAQVAQNTADILEAHPPVPGCMDPAAENYNPAAEVSDGSCTYPPVPGCMDPNATNYNAAAEVDDGSCTYPYDPAATLAAFRTAQQSAANLLALWDFESPDEDATGYKAHYGTGANAAGYFLTKTGTTEHVAGLGGGNAVRLPGPHDASNYLQTPLDWAAPNPFTIEMLVTAEGNVTPHGQFIFKWWWLPGVGNMHAIKASADGTKLVFREAAAYLDLVGGSTAVPFTAFDTYYVMVSVHVLAEQNGAAKIDGWVKNMSTGGDLTKVIDTTISEGDGASDDASWSVAGLGYHDGPEKFTGTVDDVAFYNAAVTPNVP